MPVAGTMPQSEPNLAVSAIACECVAMGWWVAAAPGAEVLALPHPAAVSARIAAIMPVPRLPVRRDTAKMSVRIAPPVPGLIGAAASRAGTGARPHTLNSAPARHLIGPGSEARSGLAAGPAKTPPGPVTNHWCGDRT